MNGMITITHVLPLRGHSIRVTFSDGAIKDVHLGELFAAGGVFAPLYELSPLAGVGPRVEQAAVGLVVGFPYVAPFEELKLKKP